MPKKDQQVIERLKDRQKDRKDKNKIGLIIEGGGMRGVFAGGVMIGLEKLGLTEAFDYIYASSSGSCAGAYFLSKQTSIGTSIYYEDLTGYRFIKPWKLRSAADIDYLCDVIFRHKKKLDTKKIKKSKTIFKIFVADADSGECTFYTNKDKVDLIDVIKASCALPLYYNKSVTIGEKEHMDGHIGKSLPIEDAITDGCTDLLVVTIVPEYYRSIEDTALVKWFKKILLSNLSLRYKEKYSNKEKLDNYNESLDVIFGRIKVHRPMNIYTISPDYLLDQFETRRGTLKRAVNHGIFKALEAFSIEKK
jgi:predicted patatin/cPLA2 family phospholipase